MTSAINMKKIFILFLILIISICLAAGAQSQERTLPPTNTTASTDAGTNADTGGTTDTGSSAVINATTAITSPVMIAPADGATVRGEVRLVAKAERANSVEFYVCNMTGQGPVYVGGGALISAIEITDWQWYYPFYTDKFPNGKYKVLAKAISPQGEYFSQPIMIYIDNPMAAESNQTTAVAQQITQAQTEISQTEQTTTSQTQDYQQQILQEQQALAEKATALLSPEETTTLSPTVTTNLSQSSPIIEQKTAELVQTTATQVQIQQQLTDSVQLKTNLENQLRISQEELTKLETQKVSDAQLQDILEAQKQDREQQIATSLEQQTTLERDIQSLQEQLRQTELTKAVLKQDIQTQVQNIAAPSLSTQDENRQTAVVRALTETQESITAKLTALEENVRAQEEIKAQQEAAIKQDSDNDGLTDQEELSLGTNPLEPDTDNDGFIDKVEKDSGYDPLQASSVQDVVYQEPTKTEAKINKTYAVKRVELTPATAGQAQNLKIEGRGLAKAFITIYIYSEPLVLITKTDENGNFVYILDKPVPDGYHKIYLAINNNKGEIVERSEVFTFLKTPTAVAAVVASDFTGAVVSPTESLSRTYTLVVGGVIVAGLIGALVVIGLVIKGKRKSNGSSEEKNTP